MVNKSDNTKSSESPRRDESLISIAVLADSNSDDIRQAVTQASAYLEAHVEFFEILILVHGQSHARHLALYEELLRLRNTRILILRDGTGEYRSAVLAAKETIGDIVLIVLASEISLFSLQTLAEEALETNGSVLLTLSSRAGFFSRIGGRVLSAISGYDVDPLLLRSGAHPRGHLSHIVAKADCEISLRFRPLNGQRDFESKVLPLSGPHPRGQRLRPWTRLGRALEIIANAPPHMLRVFAALSFLVMICSLLYLVYALVLFLSGTDLQRGWFSTSLAISGSTAFLSFALGVIAMALFQVLNLLRDDSTNEIVQELDNTNLFRNRGAANVESLEAEARPQE